MKGSGLRAPASGPQPRAPGPSRQLKERSPQPPLRFAAEPRPPRRPASRPRERPALTVVSDRLLWDMIY